MVVFPHCKINLGLHVIAKREDGYHNLETCFYPVPWADILEIIPSSEFSFSTSGDIVPGNEEDNLCIKAYKLLKKSFDLPPIKLHLHKVLPMGAGLGGGSSNGAFTLRLLNSVFKLNLTSHQLKNYASQLGSDCSFFIEDKPALASGRGEILSDCWLSLKGYYLIIVKPSIHVSTAEAYSGITPKVPSLSISEILKYPVHLWKETLMNDFERSVFKNHPEIKSLKESLYENGAIYSAMSGSGSAVFGLFKEEVNLKENNYKGITYWSGYLN